MTSDSRERSLEQLLARIILDPEVVSADRFVLLLDELGVDSQDRVALLEQGVESLLVYRRLVEGTLQSAIRTVAPTTCEHFGEGLASQVRSYLADGGPKRRTLREVVEDFFTWAEPRWLGDGAVPDHVADLARYELALVAVEAAPNPDVSEASTALSLEVGLRFQAGVRLAKFRYRVNELVAQSGTTDTALTPDETLLLLYRGAEGRAECLRLSPLAFQILERLELGDSLGNAVRSACTTLNRPTTPELLENVATLLADLASRGLFVGPTPVPAGVPQST